MKLNAENKEFLTTFLANPDNLQRVCGNAKVIAIFATGSRVLGLETDDSDYDLVVLTDGDFVATERRNWHINKKLIQWFYRDYNALLNDVVTISAHLNVTGIFWSTIDCDDILYIADNAQDKVQALITAKEQIFRNSIIGLVQYDQKWFEIILKGQIDNLIAWDFRCLRYGVLASYLIDSKPFDIDWLQTFKYRCKSGDWKREDKDYVVERLMVVYNWYLEQIREEKN